MADVIFQISAPDLCAGVVVRGGIVREAAPILCWVIGKEWGTVQAWAERKGYRITMVG